MEMLPDGLLEAMLGTRAKRISRACVANGASLSDVVDAVCAIGESLGLDVDRDDMDRKVREFTKRN